MPTIENLVLACPNCGAPLPPAANHQAVTCAFCKVTSVAAPRASSPPPASATSIATDAARASELVCPRCAVTLFEGRAGAVILEGCGRCGGVWLDNDSARRALGAKDESASVTELANRAGGRAKAASIDTSAPASCPSCRKLMARVRAPKGGVDLDVCVEHGTWFDRYELGLVLEAVHPHVIAPRAGSIDVGPIPDFRAGTGPSGLDVAMVAGGVFTILGAVLSAGDSK